MNKKILFSPVGGTDPIKYFRDGSMLHICRHYKPDIVYLYMSHEIMELHRKDNRYRDAVERLGIQLGHVFEIHLIERDELVDVQQYDEFYRDFRTEIARIEEQMDEGDELILNMASGTPAMKSALLVLATFAEYRFKPIQVSTPLKGMNSEHEDRKDYDNELNWELNEDNQEDALNRCTEVRSLNLTRMLKEEIVKKHIMAYDYAAALAVASEIREDLSEDAYHLIRIMDARVRMDHRKISRLANGKQYDIYPVKDGNKQKVFEYALVLQMKIKKGEFADFIRGITPLVVDLLENILQNKCNITLDNYCYIDRGGVRKWDSAKFNSSTKNNENAGDGNLAQILEEAYKDKGGFRDRGKPVYSHHIAQIIGHECRDIELVRKVNDMADIERNVRNIAAHEIVSVTDEWIQERTKCENNRTGWTAQQIFDILKYLLEESGIRTKKEFWQSYDRINEMIVQELQ